MNEPLAMPERLRRHIARVPTCPTAATYLLQSLHDDNIDTRKLAGIIERVPMIGMRLVALANSSWSSPVEPITSIDGACGRLGLKVVRSVSVALSISQRFNPARCPAFCLRTFWGGSMLRAEGSAMLAELIGGTESAAARTAGLLSSLGLLWLADASPQETSQALARASSGQGEGVNEALKSTCGLGLDEAGQALAEHWRLPGELQDAIANQYRVQYMERPPAIVRSVAGAAVLVRAVARDEPLSDNPKPPQLQEFGALEPLYARLAKSYSSTLEMAATLFGM